MFSHVHWRWFGVGRAAAKQKGGCCREVAASPRHRRTTATEVIDMVRGGEVAVMPLVGGADSRWMLRWGHGRKAVWVRQVTQSSLLHRPTHGSTSTSSHNNAVLCR